MGRTTSIPSIDLSLFELIFAIDDNISLTRDEKDYLIELQEEIKKYLLEHGEEGKVRIKEIVLDTLLEAEEENIIKYLGLEIPNDTKDEIEEKLNDPEFLKIETKDDNSDFFKGYLVDESLNDLYFSWKGYIKKNEGIKEIFIKTRKAIIPNRRIDALFSLLVDNFNKISFLSNKHDEETAAIIILTLDQTMEIIEEIPYGCCDTSKTVEIMSTVALKNLNLVGYNKGNKEAILSALSDSYQSRENKNERKKATDED